MKVSPIKKHSMVLRRHKTSVSLEDVFWRELRRMAKDAGTSLFAFVERLDEQRKEGSLSGTIRLAVVGDLMAKLAQLTTPVRQAAE